MIKNIDWAELAQRLGYITDNGNVRMETGGTRNAREALADIIGPEALRDAVDYFVAGGKGTETARSVLTFLRPAVAMERCHEIFLSSTDEDERSLAVNLLRSIGDDRVLVWVPQYLADPDITVQYWGIGIVREFLLNGLAEPEQCLPLIEMALENVHANVRDMAQKALDAANDLDND